MRSFSWELRTHKFRAFLRLALKLPKLYVLVRATANHRSIVAPDVERPHSAFVRLRSLNEGGGGQIEHQDFARFGPHCYLPVSGKESAAYSVAAVKGPDASRTLNVPYFEQAWILINYAFVLAEGADSPLDADAINWSSELRATARMSVRCP